MKWGDGWKPAVWRLGRREPISGLLIDLRLVHFSMLGMKSSYFYTRALTIIAKGIEVTSRPPACVCNRQAFCSQTIANKPTCLEQEGAEGASRQHEGKEAR
jgi:hypothetical protein